MPNPIVPKTSDEELLRLAEASVSNPGEPSTGMPIPPQPGAGTGQTLGLDLAGLEPSPDASPTPQEEGPLELPGDRDVATLAPTPAAALAATQSEPIAPPKGLPGAAELAAARTSDLAIADTKAAESAANAGRASADAEVATAQADQFRANEAQIAAEQLATQEGTANAQAIADKAADEYKNFKFGDWWTQKRNPDGSYRDKTEGEKIRASLFYALGNLGKGQGEENQSAKRINGIIEQWAQRDRAEVAQRYNLARLRADGVENFMRQRKEDMAVLMLRQSALTNAVADEARGQLIRNKAPVEEAENNTLVQKLRASADEKYAKGIGDLIKDQAQLAMSKAHLRIAQGQLAVAQKNSQKADVPSESEGNNAARGRNMSLALDNLEKSNLSTYQPSQEALQKWFMNQDLIEGAKENNKNPGGQVMNAIRRKYGGDGQLAIPSNEFDGLSDQDKKYFGLMRQVIEPYARKQSGAAISSSEWQNFATQTGLGTGEFGKQLREQAARDMQVLGGRATAKLEAADRERGVESPGAASVNKSPKTKTPVVVESRVIDGKTWHKLSDGRFVSE